MSVEKMQSPAPSNRKLVCIISALWGRTGSTTIFDAQTEYFKRNGYAVCRLFIEHWEKPLVRAKFLEENLLDCPPDYCIVATRQPRELAAKSATGRMIEAFADATCLNTELFREVVRRTELVVVNHTMHMGFAAAHFRVPIVLEAHDRMSEMLDIHGIPDFAAAGPDSELQRQHDEIHAIGLAGQCVALSQKDYEYFREHHPSVHYIRPLPAKPRRSSRTVREFYKDNGIALSSTRKIDVLMWGDWHNGNKHSCIKFFKEAYPLIRKDAVIVVAGRLCEVLPDDLRKLPNVRCVGRVDNLNDLFSISRVLVLYDDRGSGTSIKTLDALAAGRAFAATAASFRGLPATEGYSPSKSYKSLAKDINALLGSQVEQAKRKRIGANILKANFNEARYNQTWGTASLKKPSQSHECL